MTTEFEILTDLIHIDNTLTDMRYKIMSIKDLTYSDWIAYKTKLTSIIKQCHEIENTLDNDKRLW
jgi:hypothetical protein